MAGLSTGLKKLLTISPCKVDDSGNISVDKSKKHFEVMINPSGYSHGFSVKSDQDEIKDQIMAQMREECRQLVIDLLRRERER